MKFWSTVCSIIELTMRFGRIPDRREQVWQKTWFDSRKRECTETLLIWANLLISERRRSTVC